MNELQLYLLGIGLLVIFIVLGVNRWQEHKYRRQAEEQFSSSHDDVLLAENKPPMRKEPVLDDTSTDDDIQAPSDDDIPLPDETEFEPDIPPAWTAMETSAPEPAAIAAEAVTLDEPPMEALIEPSIEPSIRKVAPAREAVAPRAPGLAPDPATEYIAPLDASDPITAYALLPLLKQLKSCGKPVRWLGQSLHQESWETIEQASPSTEFVKLAACIQLADRNGPLQINEINAFCDMVQAVAANLYAVMDCPDKQNALDAAAKLDQFCANVDVLIGVNIIPKDGNPFAGTKLRGLAESAGMRLMPDGSFHYFNDQGEALFSLGNLEPTPFTAEGMKRLSTHGVTLIFDVPKAKGGVQAFNQMLLTARQFTAPLAALMVDDNRKVLSDAGIDKIRQQLVTIYASMEQHGIPPGGPQAGRLFA